MDYIVELPQETVVMGFAASCVEHVARCLQVPYKTVYDALKRTEAFTKYIIPHYCSLHTQSREYVTEDIIEYLRNRGESAFAAKQSQTNTLSSMEQNTYSDPLRSPEVQDIIMSGVIGCVAVEIAKSLEIEPSAALMLFYESDTCRRLHDKQTGLYLFSDRYIADDFLEEYALGKA